ncbi:MAG TPA: amidohydrolase family protein [Gemmatimonadales bacterium]|nr:amidohydrolase family protein [Gemmatimonadales bacterium]
MPSRTFGPLAALALGLLVACVSRAPDGVALVGATLIDGSGGPPLANAVVVVRGARIESVGSADGFTLPPRTTRMDVSGHWIIPGLIDGHVHLIDPQAGVLRWSIPRYLAWGVTTVRDAHGPLKRALTLRDELDRRASVGPRVYAAGAMIDGSPATYPDAMEVHTPAEARKAVDRLVSDGVDFIKLYTRIDRSLLVPIMDEVRPFNVRVSAHLGLVDARTAVRAGVASIEHMSGVPEAVVADPSGLYAAHARSFFAGWTASERAWAGLDSAGLAAVAAELAERRVVVVPTLILHETMSRLDDSTLLQDSMYRAVPEFERRRWNVPDMVTRAGWTRQDFEAFREARLVQNRFLRDFFARGGVIAAGTDAANQLMVPGYGLHREMELLANAGLSANDALVAATRNGALLIGVDSIGVVAPGKVADLVVITRDPTADIRTTRAIERVMSRGRLYAPDSIPGIR